MTAPTAQTAPQIEAIRVPLWAYALTALALGIVYLVLQENGAVLANAANYVHEFAHDGRHALGVPCH